MTDSDTRDRRRPVVLDPGEGRAYPMGRLAAIFKADGEETAHRYSISEWWLEPHTKGPGAHSHLEDDVFYVLAGIMHILVDREWIECPAGSFVVIPGTVTHDFENRTAQRAGMLNVSAPGDFGGEYAWDRQVVHRAFSGVTAAPDGRPSGLNRAALPSAYLRFCTTA